MSHNKIICSITFRLNLFLIHWKSIQFKCDLCNAVNLVYQVANFDWSSSNYFIWLNWNRPCLVRKVTTFKANNFQFLGNQNNFDVQTRPDFNMTNESPSQFPAQFSRRGNLLTGEHVTYYAIKIGILSSELNVRVKLWKYRPRCLKRLLSRHRCRTWWTHI